LKERLLNGWRILLIILCLLVLSISIPAFGVRSFPPTAIAWKPDGNYALIVGYNGIVKKFNGNSIVELNSGLSDRLDGVAWHPSGDFALIVGGQWQPEYKEGIVLKFDAESETFKKVPFIDRKDEKEKY